MKSDNLRTLRGPNLWSDDTLLEAIMVVDAELMTPAMLGRLRSWLPKALAEMTQAVWDRSEACESHHGEACLIAELTAALQRLSGCDIGAPVVHELDGGTVFRILVQYQEEEVGRKAFALAVAFALDPELPLAAGQFHTGRPL